MRLRRLLKRANDLRCEEAMSMRLVGGSVASWRAGLAQWVSESPAILGGQLLRGPAVEWPAARDPRWGKRQSLEGVVS
jgi:hypothetical protein